jgi:hypothetical protein
MPASHQIQRGVRRCQAAESGYALSLQQPPHRPGTTGPEGEPGGELAANAEDRVDRPGSSHSPDGQAPPLRELVIHQLAHISGETLSWSACMSTEAVRTDPRSGCGLADMLPGHEVTRAARWVSELAR